MPPPSDIVLRINIKKKLNTNVGVSYKTEINALKQGLGAKTVPRTDVLRCPFATNMAALLPRAALCLRFF